MFIGLLCPILWRGCATTRAVITVTTITTLMYSTHTVQYQQWWNKSDANSSISPHLGQCQRGGGAPPILGSLQTHEILKYIAVGLYNQSLIRGILHQISKYQADTSNFMERTFFCKCLGKTCLCTPHQLQVVLILNLAWTIKSTFRFWEL